MKGLRKGEMCPLHKSFFCCGREEKFKTPQNSRKITWLGPGTRRIKDDFHPRGFRELCSRAELKRRKDLLMGRVDPTPHCFYCGKDLRRLDYNDIDLCHKEPKGMGGARHDDHLDNLTLGCRECNLNNGSKRPEGD